MYNSSKRDIKGFVGEYLRLGLETNILDRDNIDTLYSRISGTKIKVDNSITGDAVVKFENDGYTIYINEEKCKNKGEYFIDEVIFHELSHLVNEVHRDLFEYKYSRIKDFEKQKSYIADGNDLVRYPTWGMILIDESIAQYTAQLLVNRKYGGNIYPEYFYETPLTDPKVYLKTIFADYPEAHKFADKFARTIYSGDSALFKLCKDSYRDTFIENMFIKYNFRENGMNDLYEILGYMGNILIADYASKGHFSFKGSEINKDKKMVLQSMSKALFKTDTIIEEN